MATSVDVPLLISTPEFNVGAPVTPEFNVIILSSTFNCSVLTVVVLPLTVKSPVTMRLFEIVTLAGRLSVTAPTPEFDTAISPAVPVNPVTRFVPLSLI